MQQNKSSVEYEENGLKIKEMLQPVNLADQEENRIAKSNAKLVFKPRYLSIPKTLWELNKYEMLIMSFLLFYADNSSDRFYFTNDQLAEMFDTSTVTVSTSFKNLAKLGYVRLHYKRKANGGQIRFIAMNEIEPRLRNLKLQLKETLRSNIKKLNGKDNKIKDNKIKDIYMSDKKKKIDKIHNHYKKKIQKRSRLTDKSRKKIEVRLKEYTVEQLLEAIDNFSNDKWWIEHNAHRGIAWFFHSEDRIEQFLNLLNAKSAQDRELEDKYGKFS